MKEILLIAYGAYLGYEIHRRELDKKLLAGIEKALDEHARRASRIMLQEIDFTFPSDSKLDELAST